MKIGLAKDMVFKNEKTRPIFAKMDDDIKDSFFLHFYHHPIPFPFIRAVDNVEVKMTVKEYISCLPVDANGVDCLISIFFSWKERFDGFEKKVLNLLPDCFKRDGYLFLRSSTFLKNKESWEKEGIDNAKDEIKKSFFDYLDRRRNADDSLGVYYVINTYYSHRSFDKGKILANMYTHQLYDLRKTVVVSGFSVGEGYSLVPLMIKYEEIYETPLEEREIWNGEF